MGKKRKTHSAIIDAAKRLHILRIIIPAFQLGFAEDNKGKTSGSRVRFFHVERKLQYLAHKPHPANIIKQKALKDIIVFLKVNNLI